MVDWILRFIKGIFIGSGFILPGVSGGHWAAVLGYMRGLFLFSPILPVISKNVLYLFSAWSRRNYRSISIFICCKLSYWVNMKRKLWFFVGCIIGTVPALWYQAGKEGRQERHIIILIIGFILSLAFMLYGELAFGGSIPQNPATWTLAGSLIGLGVIIPGLSPSNFLVYLGMYKDMSDGIKDMNFYDYISHSYWGQYLMCCCFPRLLTI